MLVGWMVIYLLAYVSFISENTSFTNPIRRYPVYSFFLPIYSFWCMDDFSWGNTRLVVGEGSNKKVLVADDDRFDESMIPLKKFSGMCSCCLLSVLITTFCLQSMKLKLGRRALITRTRRSTLATALRTTARTGRASTLVDLALSRLEATTTRLILETSTATQTS